MHNRDSLDDFHAFQSTGGGDNHGGSSGGSGCRIWFCVAVFIIYALNELMKGF